jgi:hypothetical protein
MRAVSRRIETTRKADIRDRGIDEQKANEEARLAGRLPRQWAKGYWQRLDWEADPLALILQTCRSPRAAWTY